MKRSNVKIRSQRDNKKLITSIEEIRRKKILSTEDNKNQDFEKTSRLFEELEDRTTEDM